MFAENIFTMLKSINGGEHWDTLKVDVAPSGSGLRFKFINERLGFVWGSGLYRTADGGASWQHVPLENSSLISSLQFLDERIGFIKVYNGAMLKTEDGGMQWEIISQENNQSESLYPLFVVISFIHR